MFFFLLLGPIQFKQPKLELEFWIAYQTISSNVQLFSDFKQIFIQQLDPIPTCEKETL